MIIVKSENLSKTKSKICRQKIVRWSEEGRGPLYIQYNLRDLLNVNSSYTIENGVSVYSLS